MNRRQFLSNLTSTAGALAAASAAPADPTIKRVLVMFKCHFDCGFVDTQAAVVRKYFQQYFPQAIELAARQRATGKAPYIWTTGSWLLYEYLEQASPPERKRMENAIAARDIAWHALPFTWQTELLTRSVISGALGFSQALDRRFERRTTGAKMTDVPGHSRGLVAPLAEHGVSFLDIGVNAASTPPDVPDLFVWQDPAGSSLITMYHRREYGGVVVVPHSDLAVAVAVRDDNKGPHTPEEITQIYSDLQQRFPQASIRAASLTDIAEAVVPYRMHLPVIDQEIGDTWIYGVASDPLKVARYRELLRVRAGWLQRGKLTVGDPVDLAFLSHFALAAEHTWGTDTKTWLDFDHYTPSDLAKVLEQPHYKTVTGSWIEKRADLEAAVTSLPAGLQTEAYTALADLAPKMPNTDGLRQHDAHAAIETEHFTLALDAASGDIVRLFCKTAQREWAGPENRLCSFSYQTLSKADYDKFLKEYITVQTDWAPKDFGKPNIESFGAQSRLWNTRLIRMHVGEDADAQRVVAHLEIDQHEGAMPAVAAWPAQLFLELTLPRAEPMVNVQLSWFGKRANRLPEALWFTYTPIAPETGNWLLSKVEQWISPFEVVSGGNRHMHAVSGAIRYRDGKGGLTINTVDAPLVALGERSPIYFSNTQPNIAQGLHFSLFNNGWGTNYVQWFGEDMKFRFSLRTTA